jgi:hypothetical protein
MHLDNKLIISLALIYSLFLPNATLAALCSEKGCAVDCQVFKQTFEKILKDHQIIFISRCIRIERGTTEACQAYAYQIYYMSGVLPNQLQRWLTRSQFTCQADQAAIVNDNLALPDDPTVDIIEKYDQTRCLACGGHWINTAGKTGYCQGCTQESVKLMETPAHGNIDAAECRARGGYWTDEGEERCQMDLSE